MSFSKKIIPGVFLVLTVCFISSAALARDLFVTRFDDPSPDGCESDDCSLREAVEGSNTAGDIFNFIHMPFGTYTLTQGGALLVEDNSQTTERLTVEGNGSTIDASALNDRIFQTNGAALDLILNDLTLTGGSAGEGGAILFQGTDTSDILILNRVLITENFATGGGNGGGGLLVENGNVSCNYSTISGNFSATVGGGISVKDSVFGTLNCTISGNQANTDGGGVYANGDVFSFVSIDFSTVTNNTAGGEGGGAFLNQLTSFMRFHNSILAENTAGSGSQDCNKDPVGATVISLGGNIFGDIDDCAITLETNDQDDVADAGLQPLANYGGPTPTHLLDEDSIARDNAPPGCLDDCDDPVFDDQRLQGRAVGGSCDSGAVELQESDLTISKQANETTVNRPGTVIFTLTVTNNGPGNNFNVTVTDDLPEGAAFQLAFPSQGTCSHAAGVVTCELGEMEPGDSVTIAIVATLFTVGTNTNTASVTGTEIETNPDDNSDFTVVLVEEDGDDDDNGGCILAHTPSGRNLALPLGILILATAWFLARKRLT